MKAKALEIRDRMTFIPALAVELSPVDWTLDVPTPAFDAQLYLLRRCGYPCDGRPRIMLTKMAGEEKASSDPHFWGDRTWATAHLYIIEHWHELVDGAVIDVEFIRGESAAPKKSEREEHPL